MRGYGWAAVLTVVVLAGCGESREVQLERALSIYNADVAELERREELRGEIQSDRARLEAAFDGLDDMAFRSGRPLDRSDTSRQDSVAKNNEQLARIEQLIAEQQAKVNASRARVDELRK